MKRVLFAGLGALCLLTASAFADEGLPSTSVLDDMGLSGMQILSDSDALAVRGKGWAPDFGAINGSKPWAAVGGLSEAEYEGRHGEAESVNFYLAKGKYEAKGKNMSYANKVRETVDVRIVNDNVDTNIHTYTRGYVAGGSSSASAF